MRVTTAFSRLLRLPGVWVKKVRFEPDRVIVSRWRCAAGSWSARSAGTRRGRARTRGRRTRSGGILISGSGGLRSTAAAGGCGAREHGARTEGVPFARPGAEFTRDFECLVAWLATRTDKTTIKRMLRIDWDTVGRIIKRVCDDELDPGRLDDLYDIGIDEVSWKRQHKYLTLVVDHHRRQVVWGCEGSRPSRRGRVL